MERVDTYDVCFQISGADMNPDDISEQLGLSPDECFSPHESTGMRNGATIERASSDIGTWVIRGISETEPIPKQIEQILVILRPLKEKLLNIKKTGLNMRFYCGYFADDSTAGLSLSNDLMMEMGSLGINFDISFYCNLQVRVAEGNNA